MVRPTKSRGCEPSTCTPNPFNGVGGGDWSEGAPLPSIVAEEPFVALVPDPRDPDLVSQGRGLVTVYRARQPSGGSSRKRLQVAASLD